MANLNDQTGTTVYYANDIRKIICEQDFGSTLMNGMVKAYCERVQRMERTLQSVSDVLTAAKLMGLDIVDISLLEKVLYETL